MVGVISVRVRTALNKFRDWAKQLFLLNLLYKMLPAKRTAHKDEFCRPRRVHLGRECFDEHRIDDSHLPMNKRGSIRPLNKLKNQFNLKISSLHCCLS